MTEKQYKIGCLGIIGIIILISLIVDVFKTCRRNIRSHDEIIVPTHTYFRCDDNSNYHHVSILFQGEDWGDVIAYRQDNSYGVHMPYPNIYFKIKNGDELYDKSGEYFGYIKVMKDGSFKIKDSDLFNGHYYGENGAKAKIKNAKMDKLDDDLKFENVVVIDEQDLK